MKSRIATVCAAAAVTGLASVSFAQVELDDLAGSATINLPGISTNGGDAGVVSLRRNVGGGGDLLEDIQQQWYWIGINGAAEVSIDQLAGGTMGPTVSTTSFGSQDGNRVRAMYGVGEDISVRVQYELSGGSAGSYKNTLSRVATIFNNSNTTQTVSFFSFSDLALTNIITPPVGFLPDDLDETALALNASGSRIRQFDVLTINGTTVVTDSTTLANPTPSAIQIGDAADILAALNDGSATTLDGTSDFGDPAGNETGENIGFAYQWDITLAPGQAYAVAEDLLITPEPSTFLVLGGSGMLLALRRRNRHEA
jgi:hypothetical protein